MKPRDYLPGVPAAGHITGLGGYHPGRAATCAVCKVAPPPHPWVGRVLCLFLGHREGRRFGGEGTGYARCARCGVAYEVEP